MKWNMEILDINAMFLTSIITNSYHRFGYRPAIFWFYNSNMIAIVDSFIVQQLACIRNGVKFANILIRIDQRIFRFIVTDNILIQISNGFLRNPFPFLIFFACSLIITTNQLAIEINGFQTDMRISAYPFYNWICFHTVLIIRRFFLPAYTQGIAQTLK